jgi:polyhydroxyalkanoate synthesis regulator phasin
MKNQLTVSEKLQDKENELENNTQHSLKLFYAMEGHPEEYSWNGEILELDRNAKCACGHPIRNGFPLVHKTNGNTVIVGCVCVENAPHMTEELISQMKTAQKTLAQKIAAAKKAEREMAQDSQIAALTTERTTLIQAAKDLRAAHMSIRVSYTYWKICAGRYGFKRVECYKAKAACIKTLKENIETLKRCMAELEAQPEAKLFGS